MTKVSGLLVGAGLLCLILPNDVMAADKPVARPIAEKTYDWSGYYFGGNVGYGWRNSFKFPESNYSSLNVANLDPALPSSRHKGGTFDVGFGYNRQHGWFVWGLDYEFQYANLGGTPNYRGRYFALPRTGTTTTSTTDIYGNIIGSTTSTTSTLVPYTALYDATDGDSNKWYGIVRLRGGVAFDRLLLFATGGAVYRLSYNYTDPYVINSNGTTTYYSGINHENNWGALVGGGVEYAVTENVSIKADYLHTDFGTATYVDPIASVATGTIVTYTTRRTNDIVRLGLNLRINIPALGGSYGGSGY